MRNQGEATNIPGRDGRIHLNVKYLERLSGTIAYHLLDTIIHEGFHLTRPAIDQVPPLWDHGYINAETVKRVGVTLDAFDTARAKACAGK
jgi:hypothetical protein